jgi:hypothetical protein
MPFVPVRERRQDVVPVSIDENKRRIAESVMELNRDKTYAFTVVPKRGRDWQLAVCVEGEPGYNPLEGIDWHKRDDAQKWASDLNSHIGLSTEAVHRIILSTMRETRR